MLEKIDYYTAIKSKVCPESSVPGDIGLHGKFGMQNHMYTVLLDTNPLPLWTETEEKYG